MGIQTNLENEQKKAEKELEDVQKDVNKEMKEAETEVKKAEKELEGDIVHQFKCKCGYADTRNISNIHGREFNENIEKWRE